MTMRTSVLIAGMVWALGATPDRPQSITQIDFVDSSTNPPRNATQTRCNGISPTGAIVGTYVVSGTHGFLLDQGVFTSIDVPGAASTNAFGINAYGDIVGFYRLPSSGSSRGFLLADGMYYDILFPGASETTPLAINAQGEIVGRYNDAAGLEHGFFLRHGTFDTIDFPNADSSGTDDINDHGEIVGDYVLNKISHMYLLSSGVFTPIDYPGATQTGPRGVSAGINNKGEIVGGYVMGGTIHGFLLDAKGDFTTLDIANATLTSTRAINAEGNIVGFYRQTVAGAPPFHDHGFLIQR